MFKLIIFCVFLQSQISTIANSEIIKWSKDRKIAWTDFKAKAITNSNVGASSCISLTVEVITKTSIRYLLEINPAFHPYGSWVWLEKVSDSALKHEQSHFDIYEIWARKMRKKLMSEQNKYNLSQMDVRFKELLQSYSDSVNIISMKYDIETNHALNKNSQLEWDSYIKKELNRLSSYSYTYVTINLRY